MDVLVDIRRLSKTFDDAEVLHRVDLTILPGEAHGLVGENGSGKSTVIKILAGFHDPDPGCEIRVNGRVLEFPMPPRTSGELGLAFVHQDLALIPSLTVAENLFATEIGTTRARRHSSRGLERRARERLAAFNVDLDPHVPVASVSQVERALLAIVRAAATIRDRTGTHQRGLLVLDEPTVFLSRDDRERLYLLIQEVVGSGSSVLFVSHDLDECLSITHRISVLRDGYLQGTVIPGAVTKSQLVEMMIGRHLDDERRDGAERRSATVLATVNGLRTRSIPSADITVHAGEVVGITGVMGSGFDEIPYAVFGAAPGTQGSVSIDGTTHDLARLTPVRAVDAGMALVPGDRLRDGAAGSLSVADNITALILRSFERFGILRRGAANTDATATARRFDVRPPDPGRLLKSLSGGNQQKVVLAKWLRTRPRLILLHEPTQGVDVGARQQIYSIIRDVAAAGAGVICASADHEQLAALCDRVLVVVDGRIVAELEGLALTKHEIGRQAYGLEAAAA